MRCKKAKTHKMQGKHGWCVFILAETYMHEGLDSFICDCRQMIWYVKHTADSTASVLLSPHITSQCRVEQDLHTQETTEGKNTPQQTTAQLTTRTLCKTHTHKARKHAA